MDVLLRRYHADHTLRDKSNRTALDLSIEKRNVKCEWSVRKNTAESFFSLYREIITKRYREKQ